MKTPPKIVPAGLPWLDNSGQYIAHSGRFHKRSPICVMPKTTIRPDKARFLPPHRSSSEPRSRQSGANWRTLSRRWGDGLSETSERGVTAQRVVKSRVRRSHLRRQQHNVRTVLSVVRKGRMWRVQITRPNGCVRYFGRFSSATRARDWIAAHACLINLVQPIRKQRPLWVIRDRCA